LKKADRVNAAAVSNLNLIWETPILIAVFCEMVGAKDQNLWTIRIGGLPSFASKITTVGGCRSQLEVSSHGLPGCFPERQLC
jgi:hypothetical protein